MTSFQLLLLPKLTEPAENLLVLNDAGEVLVSHREHAARDGSFPRGGVGGTRFHTLTGKRLTLRYALSDAPSRPVTVVAMNRRGEVVGGYAGSLGSEGSHGLFWDSSGKMSVLSGGIGVAINDVGQVITDDTHFTDGQRFGEYMVGLAPGVRGRPVGALHLASARLWEPGGIASGINVHGAVVGPGLALWQPGAYGQGHIVEQNNPDNANTPFAGGSRPMITDDGIIVCLGTSPLPVAAEGLRFHRWKPGASSTAVPLSLPADSVFRVGGKLLPGAYRLTTVGANARGEILLNVEGECSVSGRRQHRAEAVLWRKDGSAQRLPQLRSGLLLNNLGWILGVSSENGTRYALLRPKG